MESPSSTPPPADETPSQRQARQRRERRQAKIAAGGSDRLAAITGVQGRKASDPLPISRSSSNGSLAKKISSTAGETGRPSTPLSSSVHASVDDDVPDPDHMDIAEFMPSAGRGPQQSGAGGIFGGLPEDHPARNDPMMKMLEQMMGNAGMDPNGPGGPAGFGGGADGLPDFASLLGGAAGGAGGLGALSGLFGEAPSVEDQPKPTVSAATWKIIHAVSSILLAIYVVLSSPVPFNGSKASRELANLDGVGSSFGSRLFFWFATVEVVLQSSRFVMEKGQVASTGMFGTLTKLLPEPWAGYLRIIWRYSVIGTTVISDGLVLVFVLGVLAWWNSGVAQ
jgi:hypothetical protein